MYVVSNLRPYKDAMGGDVVLYHVGFPLGIMHELTGDLAKAAKYRTKAEATRMAKQLGSKWKVEKVEA